MVTVSKHLYFFYEIERLEFVGGLEQVLISLAGFLFACKDDFSGFLPLF